MFCSKAFNSVLKPAYHPIGIEYSETRYNNSIYILSLTAKLSLVIVIDSLYHSKWKNYAVVCIIVNGKIMQCPWSKSQTLLRYSHILCCVPFS